ncbi:MULTISPECIES: TRAP transporter large permease [Zunongwangia]|jgi:tripartite ATP-independent transporter DctM subunit|uniref:Ribosomal protein L16 n=2 Tax=Zunongwangia profunda TaxID=398743 RepID=D5BHF3_ZUNPS|nr:TRAP transporter large permease [Zunongwangia profunda]MAG88943.1 TRAP transporter large permease [Flavobacteriaceae bacterium]MAS70838.1 TRAP transporter large permease [Zunongwangia sp.]ADF53351.1 Ribosomal protein L16 [Zunongwangia profunda SM-A87]MAS72392.1 TRAP transporter large permease [Zunongwangia sp.]MCC4230727.1 TRAP transporter large permease [Zunongwangia profunda]|tara:strand:+ start:1500 stop:2786 length:1287 start_codon:yes stop_codon:yes gene_type:complete
MEIFILAISFIILVGIRVPVAWSIGIASLITLLFSIDSLPAVATIAQRMVTGLDSFSLLAIPFFILAGHLMNSGGIARRLIVFAKSLVGSLPGGLAHVNIVAAMLFGAIAGSAGAAAAAIGSFMSSKMEEEGYTKEYGVAVNVTSATTGLLIPPSNIFIIYSLASGGVSIGALFLAGYIPGILTGLILMIIALIWAKRKGFPTAKRASVSEVLKSFLDALPSLMLLLVIIGGIVGGIFTATEASSVAVVYCLILGLIYKELSLDKLKGILIKSAETIALVMILIALSIAMSWVMSYADIPEQVTSALLGYSDNPIVVMIMINLILLVIGIFMDMTPAVLIFTPIFLPVVTALGIDPVHFGVIMVLNLCIGLCTPPVGSVLFIGVGVANTSIKKVIKPLMPLFVGMLISLMLVILFPKLSLWLPELFGL